MAEIGIEFLRALGITDVLLWLLSFALIYGILTHIEMFKKMKAFTAIVAIVLGLFVLMSPVRAAMAVVLSNMGTALVAVLLGILLVVVFLEIGGIKHKQRVETGKKHPQTGEPIYEEKLVPFVSKNPYVLAITFILIAIIIFIAAGGPQLLGIAIPAVDLSGAAFLILILLAVLWMIRG
jgi:hypothetical protein